MGCDIHFFVETKQQDGSWKIHGEFELDGTSVDDWLIQKDRPLYTGRCYNLFAILADVRNGRGFAGTKTGEGFNPISLPRGVPDDASKEYKAIVEQWGYDGHSHSYHTIRQLLDYDWTQTTGLQGWVNFSEWEQWSRWRRGAGEGPQSRCGGVWGESIVRVEPAEMDTLLEQYNKLESDELRKAFAAQHSKHYALAKWTEPYFIAAGSFVGSTIPQLLALAGGVDGIDNVRCIFFFDN